MFVVLELQKSSSPTPPGRKGAHRHDLKENRENTYCEITPELLALKQQWEKKNYIDPKLYKEYNVKRDSGTRTAGAVLTGLTRVAEIQSYDVTEGEHIIPTDGVLYYQGIDCRGHRHRLREPGALCL